jgi:hypothetical protein
MHPYFAETLGRERQARLQAQAAQRRLVTTARHVDRGSQNEASSSPAVTPAAGRRGADRWRTRFGRPAPARRTIDDRDETITTNGSRGCGFEAAHVAVVGARTPFDDVETAQLRCQR